MTNQILRRGSGFLSIFCLFVCHAAQAGVLVLKNGDRITGEITRIWDSEISIEPEYSDEFQVDVSAVSHIESARQFEIELDLSVILGTEMLFQISDHIAIEIIHIFRIGLAANCELVRREIEFELR